MNLKQMRAAALKAAQDILSEAKGRELSADEEATVQAKFAEIEDLDKKIAAGAASKSRFDALAALGEPAGAVEEERGESAPKSIGEHFVKHAGARLKEIRGVNGASASAPEFKAATDTHVVGSVFQTPVLTQFDRAVIQGYRYNLTVADLLGSGTLSGNAISYFVEGALEGAFTTVAEGAAKPQLHIVDPTLVTDSLKKIAGFIKMTDEMVEDLDFFVSEINQRLLYELAKFEENQLLNGNGTGSNVQGLLNRSGIGTQARTIASGDTAADTIFKAITSVQTATGLTADGMIMNPADYQTLRLAKDGNGQYYGGGFFNGAYGNGGIADQPNVWGLRTVLTPAIAAGTVLVGAFGQAATVYRKGGVRVESTNSHASDFTSNLVTVRAEERVALAVRRPLALVKTNIVAV